MRWINFYSYFRPQVLILEGRKNKQQVQHWSCREGGVHECVGWVSPWKYLIIFCFYHWVGVIMQRFDNILFLSIQAIRACIYITVSAKFYLIFSLSLLKCFLFQPNLAWFLSEPSLIIVLPCLSLTLPLTTVIETWQLIWSDVWRCQFSQICWSFRFCYQQLVINTDQAIDSWKKL